MHKSGLAFWHALWLAESVAGGPVAMKGCVHLTLLWPPRAATDEAGTTERGQVWPEGQSAHSSQR